MSEPKILVAGIGNVFLGDDAFGVEVLQQLMRRKIPDCVRAIDFGIRGLDLVYALLDGYDAAILVDTTARGGQPGTLYMIEVESPETSARPPETMELDAHGMNPMRVLEMARSMGSRTRRVYLVGCEPATFGDELEGAMGLSPTVAAAVDGAIVMIESLVSKIAVENRETAAV